MNYEFDVFRAVLAAVVAWLVIEEYREYQAEQRQSGGGG